MVCCNGCFIKTTAFIAALLSVAVLALSTIVLISSVTYSTTESKGGHNQSDTSINTTAPLKPGLKITNSQNESNYSHVTPSDSTTTSSPAPGWNLTNTENVTTTETPQSLHPLLNGEEEGGNREETTTTPKPEAWKNFFEHRRFWKGKSDTYIILMQASSGTGVFAALLQLGFSWFLICGSARDLKERTKLWNLSNFIVLVLLVVIILVPLSYDQSSRKLKGISEFGRQVWRRVMAVEFSWNTLDTIASSPGNFLKEDVNLFYYVMGADAFILLTFLIPPILFCFFYPCRRCCCKKEKSGRTDSDLMLFGGEPF